MKKILYSVMALAIAAMTFTACEDVPEPYPTPVPGQKPVVTYEGEGTLEKPYTVADAINYAKFAANTLPYDEVNKKPLAVDITGIATRYRDTWQVLIRKESDIVPAK